MTKKDSFYDELIRALDSINDRECGSDHHLLVAKIFFPYRKAHHEIKVNLQQKPGSINTTWKASAGILPDFHISSALNAKLTRGTDGTPNNMYEQIKQCIHEALGSQTREPATTKYSSQWNDSLELFVETKKQAYEKWIETKHLEDRDTYRNKR